MEYYNGDGDTRLDISQGIIVWRGHSLGGVRSTITNVVSGAKVPRLDDWDVLASFKSRVKGQYQDIRNYKPSDPGKHKSGEQKQICVVAVSN